VPALPRAALTLFKKASCMTDPATVPEAAEAAETAHFLRRFADLMSNGQNAEYLMRAADLLDALIGRVSSASDEEQLWRYKYETLTHQNDELETECESLRHDIERHVKLSSFIITERDTLKTTLQGREAELLELGDTCRREQDALKLEQDNLKREQEAAATKSQEHELALAEVRAGLDQERVALKASLDASIKQIEQQRQEFQRERDELSAKLSQKEAVMAEFRLAFDRERDDWRSRLGSREDELAAIRVATANEHEELQQRIEALETKREELRSAFDRISQLGVAAPDHRADAPDGSPSHRSGETMPAPHSAVVPKETLRQARAQFAFLAKECVRRGDVATQAMCELGAHTMDQALVAEETTHPLPVGEVALSILGPSLGPGAAPHPTRQVSAENY
jgi:chromosome segregation ATPase